MTHFRPEMCHLCPANLVMTHFRLEICHLFGLTNISMTHFRPENAAPHQQIYDMTNDSMLLVTNLLF